MDGTVASAVASQQEGLGFTPGLVVGTFCVEFVCFSHVCVSSLHTVQTLLPITLLTIKVKGINKII